ncbi:uncharacterized protein KY384_005741 [Bacidia gigantensis]|uniref:uncharacterized protein n=1 Tax=Bacidia gigantensis TaxID=2732470 RepID=UPI001D04A957|nr:uncharacterized protein KY384_005741 [Bacidia gigantensis]KAG8529106.1 hypothetical protein KY384_005741 [Bacidia gigantensis]
MSCDAEKDSDASSVTDTSITALPAKDLSSSLPQKYIDKDKISSILSLSKDDKPLRTTDPYNADKDKGKDLTSSQITSQLNDKSSLNIVSIRRSGISSIVTPTPSKDQSSALTTQGSQHKPTSTLDIVSGTASKDAPSTGVVVTNPTPRSDKDKDSTSINEELHTSTKDAGASSILGTLPGDDKTSSLPDKDKHSTSGLSTFDIKTTSEATLPTNDKTSSTASTSGEDKSSSSTSQTVIVTSSPSSTSDKDKASSSVPTTLKDVSSSSSFTGKSSTSKSGKYDDKSESPFTIFSDSSLQFTEAETASSSNVTASLPNIKPIIITYSITLAPVPSSSLSLTLASSKPEISAFSNDIVLSESTVPSKELNTHTISSMQRPSNPSGFSSKPEQPILGTAVLSSKGLMFPSKPTLTVSSTADITSFPGYSVVPSPSEGASIPDKGSYTNLTSPLIPVWTQPMLGNGYGGGFVTTPSIYVTKLPSSNETSILPPGYGSASSMASLPMTTNISIPSSLQEGGSGTQTLSGKSVISLISLKGESKTLTPTGILFSSQIASLTTSLSKLFPNVTAPIVPSKDAGLTSLLTANSHPSTSSTLPPILNKSEGGSFAIESENTENDNKLPSLVKTSSNDKTPDKSEQKIPPATSPAVAVSLLSSLSGNPLHTNTPNQASVDSKSESKSGEAQFPHTTTVSEGSAKLEASGKLPLAIFTTNSFEVLITPMSAAQKSAGPSTVSGKPENSQLSPGDKAEVSPSSSEGKFEPSPVFTISKIELATTIIKSEESPTSFTEKPEMATRPSVAASETKILPSIGKPEVSSNPSAVKIETSGGSSGRKPEASTFESGGKTEGSSVSIPSNIEGSKSPTDTKPEGLETERSSAFVSSKLEVSKKFVDSKPEGVTTEALSVSASSKLEASTTPADSKPEEINTEGSSVPVPSNVEGPRTSTDSKPGGVKTEGSNVPVPSKIEASTTSTGGKSESVKSTSPAAKPDTSQEALSRLSESSKGSLPSSKDSFPTGNILSPLISSEVGSSLLGPAQPTAIPLSVPVGPSSPYFPLVKLSPQPIPNSNLSVTAVATYAGGAPVVTLPNGSPVQEVIGGSKTLLSSSSLQEGGQTASSVKAEIVASGISDAPAFTKPAVVALSSSVPSKVATGSSAPGEAFSGTYLSQDDTPPLASASSIQSVSGSNKVPASPSIGAEATTSSVDVPVLRSANTADSTTAAASTAADTTVPSAFGQSTHVPTSMGIEATSIAIIPPPEAPTSTEQRLSASVAPADMSSTTRVVGGVGPESTLLAGPTAAAFSLGFYSSSFSTATGSGNVGNGSMLLPPTPTPLPFEGFGNRLISNYNLSLIIAFTYLFWPGL